MNDDGPKSRASDQRLALRATNPSRATLMSRAATILRDHQPLQATLNTSPPGRTAADTAHLLIAHLASCGITACFDSAKRQVLVLDEDPGSATQQTPWLLGLARAVAPLFGNDESRRTKLVFDPDAGTLLQAAYSLQNQTLTVSWSALTESGLSSRPDPVTLHELWHLARHLALHQRKPGRLPYLIMKKGPEPSDQQEGGAYAHHVLDELDAYRFTLRVLHARGAEVQHLAAGLSEQRGAQGLIEGLFRVQRTLKADARSAFSTLWRVAKDDLSLLDAMARREVKDVFKRQGSEAQHGFALDRIIETTSGAQITCSQDELVAGYRTDDVADLGRLVAAQVRHDMREATNASLHLFGDVFPFSRQDCELVLQEPP